MGDVILEIFVGRILLVHLFNLLDYPHNSEPDDPELMLSQKSRSVVTFQVC